MPSLLGGSADRDEQSGRTQHLQTEPEARHAHGEHDARVGATERSNLIERVAGVEDMVRAEGSDELEPLLPDVDADHLVPERGGDLHGVVPEPAGGADDRDPIDRAARRDPRASSRRRRR